MKKKVKKPFDYPKKGNSHYMGVVIDEYLRERLQKIAMHEHRSVGSVIRLLLNEALETRDANRPTLTKETLDELEIAALKDYVKKLKEG